MAPRGSAAKGPTVKDAEALLKIMKYLGGLGNDDAFEAVSSYDNLKVWWNTAVSSDIPAFPTGKKWLDLLEDDDWREAMVLFVSTGIGHKSWTLSLASKMQKHDFADIWLGLIDETNVFFEKLFPNEAKDAVREIDLRLISALPVPRHPEHIRHWFYPKEQGFYEQFPRGMEYASANPKLFEPYFQRETMKRMVTKPKVTFTHKRSGFLENLTAAQYLHVFDALVSPEGADLRVWTWEALKRRVDQGVAIAEQLYHHIYFWYDPLYEPEKPEKRGKSDDKAISWIHRLDEKFFHTDIDGEGVVDIYGEGAVSTEEEEPAETLGDDSTESEGEHLGDTEIEMPAQKESEDPLEAATAFIDEILNLVEKDFGIWDSAEFRGMLQYTPILCYAPGKMAERESLQKKYVERFRHSQWVDILEVCKRRITTKAFNGIVADVKASGSLPWAKWTTIAETALADSLWKAHDRKGLTVEECGVKLAFDTYIEISGAKWSYLQKKEELKMVLEDPRESDKVLLNGLRGDITRCADFLGGHGIQVYPDDLEEDATGLILGASQKSQKRDRSDDGVNGSEEEAVAGAGEAVVDEGRWDPPKSDESQKEKTKKTKKRKLK